MAVATVGRDSQNTHVSGIDEFGEPPGTCRFPRTESSPATQSPPPRTLPSKGMGVFPFARRDFSTLRLALRTASAVGFPFRPLPVELNHPLPCGFILHFPEAHDQSTGTSDFKSTSQSEHALPRLNPPQPSLACGENDPIDAGKIQRGYLLGGQNPILSINFDFFPPVRSCQCQAERGERASGDVGGPGCP
jgi:hypothetical protein